MHLIELQSLRVLCSDWFLKSILYTEKFCIPMQISLTSGKFMVCLNSFNIIASKFVQLFMGSSVVMASKDLPIMLKRVEGFPELAGTHGNFTLASTSLDINFLLFSKVMNWHNVADTIFCDSMHNFANFFVSEAFKALDLEHS